MIKRLRRQIFITVFGILTFTFFLLLFILNVSFGYRFYQEEMSCISKNMAAYENMYFLSSRRTGKQNKFGKEEQSQGDMFLEKGDGENIRREEKGVVYIVTVEKEEIISGIFPEEGIHDFTQGELNQLGQKLWDKKQTRGTYENLRYEALQWENGEGIILFLDCYDHRKSRMEIGLFSVIGFLSGMGVFFLSSLFLSKKICHPVEESFLKQRQFISDAGHELKTPLAVIQANGEVLESEIGENKWLAYILSETDRMNLLIRNLLVLTKIEETDSAAVFESFSISQAIMSVALPFESIAFEAEILYEIKISENLIYHGNEAEIKQLAAIFLDNAMKHTKKGGKVLVSLKKSSVHKRQYQLIVKNTGETIPEEEKEKIFERFYRVDRARNREEGRYGLGLAIAKTIVEKHHGKIKVSCEDGWNIFEVLL